MVRKIALDVAGAYNGTGSMLHWMTPLPDFSPKTFWGPKFELPALKCVYMVQIVQFQFAISQLYIGLWRISSH